MSERLHDVLDEGLTRIIAGNTDVQSFLAEHPAEADEIGPLLDAALAVRKASTVAPDPNFARLARAQFAAQVQAGPRRRWWHQWRLSWSTALRPVALAAVAVVTAGSLAAGTVTAAQEALPGEPLYGIKRAEENARLMVVRDDLDRAAFRARLAEVRLRELRRLDEQHATQHGDHLVQEVADHMRAVAIAVEQDRQSGGQLTPETRAKIVLLQQQLRRSVLHDPELLQSLAGRMPPARRAFMARILRAAQEEYQRSLENVEPGTGAGAQPPDGPAVHPRSAPLEPGGSRVAPADDAGGSRPRPLFQFQTPPAPR